MALNSTVLSNLFVANLESKFPKGFNKTQRNEIEKFTEAFAEAIIEHFTTEAQITVSTTVTTPVTPSTSLQRIPASVIVGTPTDGPVSTVNLSGTGTGTATIS